VWWGKEKPDVGTHFGRGEREKKREKIQKRQMQVGKAKASKEGPTTQPQKRGGGFAKNNQLTESARWENASGELDSRGKLRWGEREE